MKRQDRPLCPSAPLTPKAQLFGVVTAGGQIAYLDKTIDVDAQFAEDANKGREPESRFRFAAPCARAGCSNWDAGGCSLPARVATDLKRHDTDLTLSDYSIRDRCVWHAQSGPSACLGCRYVVTRAH
jgi:hypothetical protein